MKLTVCARELSYWKRFLHKCDTDVNNERINLLLNLVRQNQRLELPAEMKVECKCEKKSFFEKCEDKNYNALRQHTCHGVVMGFMKFAGVKSRSFSKNKIHFLNAHDHQVLTMEFRNIFPNDKTAAVA